ncbi:MAG: hypothetical protein WC979_03040 [Candidatus Pacearchaeota archaeon]|jgi:hypothetical protein|nr:hypothetical protein [Clostridia bacterium]
MRKYKFDTETLNQLKLSADLLSDNSMSTQLYSIIDNNLKKQLANPETEMYGYVGRIGPKNERVIVVADNIASAMDKLEEIAGAASNYSIEINESIKIIL